MKQIIPTTGFVNTDNQARTMPLGEHPYLSMVENGAYYGKGGALVTKRGTLNTGSILSVGEIIIGSAKWIERNRIIYFVYNPMGDHRICYYDIATNTHVSMGDVVYAGFDPNYPIWHAEVIDNVLWWSDGKFEGYWDSGTRLFNPPFRLNLQRWEDGEYPSSLDLQTIDVIKYPSPFSPTWEYGGSSLVKYNYLRKKLFQFRVQYVYEDGEESAWSPISRMNLQGDSGYINGSYGVRNEDSLIELTFNTGHETVRQIRIAVSVNKSQFGVFKVIDKEIESIPSNIDYVLEYLGNTSFDAVPLDTRNYDNVPQSAVCFNRLVNEVAYTNIVQGFDRLDPNVDIEYPITELEGYKLNSHRLSYIGNSTPPNNVLTLHWDNVLSGDLLLSCEGDMYTNSIRVSIGSDIESVVLQYVVTQAVINTIYALPTPQDGRNSLLTTIGNSFVTTLIAAGAPCSGSLVGTDFVITLTSDEFYGDLDNEGTRPYRKQNTQRTLKKGGLYKWYIQYYDRANRDGTALTTEAMQLKVPFVTDQDVSSLSYGGAPYKVNAKLTINHYPPNWATHYQIVVSKDNGISSFMQTTVTSIQVLDDGNFRLSLQQDYQIKNVGATINHQPQKGDRVRFMQVGVGDTETPSPVNYVTNYFECEVMNVELTGGVDNSVALYVQRFNLSLIDWNDRKGFQVEVYTPSKDSDVELLYEVGEEYAITNEHQAVSYHTGNVQDQTDTLPAILDLDYGDVYIRERQLGTGYDYPNNMFYWYCEDPHYSDYFVSNFNSQGRVAIEDVRAKNERLNLSIHGGKFVRGTNINNLCVFEFGENTQEYDPQYGFVVRTFVDGKTLKVLQPLKENSVYLNGTYSVNSDGNISAPAFSKVVFGGLRPYEGTLGCSHAGMAILVPKMGVFYFDSINGEFIYSLNNGQSRVSLNGYLKGSLDFLTIAKGGNVRAYAFVESELGKVGINVSSDVDRKTVCFNYESMRFVADQVAKRVWGYANIGDVLIAFDENDSNTYLYNQEGSFTFHNAEFNSVVEVVSNDMPEQTKRFKSISLQSLKAWGVDASCPPDGSYPLQATSMSAGKLEKLEGAYFSQYRKNIYSGTIKPQEYYRLNGNDLRSYAIVNTLTHVVNNENEGNDLTLVVVESEPSELITRG